eukprot:scaffold34597_cov177-Amphora_coffeaeformis.AAC.32
MSSSIGRKAFTEGAPRFHSALKKLADRGVQALQPTRVVVQGIQNEVAVWRSPAISNRIASVLRKTAIREGSYGTFDAQTLKGWDAQWDIDLEIAKAGGNGRRRLRVPKKTSRQRTRETRARKIETNMDGMEERIEQFYADKQAKKPPDTIENMYKKLMRAKK